MKREGIVRVIIFLFIAIMICGCIIIVSESDEVRVFDIHKEEGLDTLERIEKKSAQEKREIKWFERKE